MRRHFKVVLVALAAAAALLAVAGTATALRSISVNPAGPIRATSGAVTFRASIGTVICPVTLNGELGSAIPKTEGALGGRITSGTVGPERTNCRISLLRSLDATPTMLFPEAWHVRYVSIEGTLPRIVAFKLVVLRASFLIAVTGPFGERYRCLYIVDQGSRIRVEARGASREIEIISQTDRVFEERLREGDTACPNGSLAATFNLEAARTITLI